ncbi:ceramide phosphoethanolamine synthase [Hydra vulgaris]|uniref:Ceramide phosphoethanolamine synthase n=1 Tax=Hydra vulgaris TaxID=6087 RepID=A0ABM4CJ07_HYDVU
MESYKYKSLSYTNNHYGFYLMFGLITYFIWCDLNFFGELSAEQELGFNLANITQNFPSISIKLRMQDHFAHYVYLPFCQWVEDTFKISKVPGITPNVITAVHFTLAFCAARVLAYPEVFFSKLAAIIFEVRTMLDTMDGVVYRAQSSLNTYVSGWGSYGFIIDGIADTVGGIFLTIALIYKFNKNPPFQNFDDISLMRKKHNFDQESSKSLLTSDESISKENEDLYGLVRYSKKTVNFTIIFFTILVIIRSSLWDYFNHNYHNLFALRRQDIPLEKQWEVLGYKSTWFSLWLWKTTSADAFMHFTLISILFNKLWEWLRFNMYASIIHIICVSMICQVHLMHVRYVLGVSS